MYGGSGAYYDPGHLFRFDPLDPWTRTDLGVPVAGSTEVVALAVGSDGLIYGATGDQYTVFSYDPTGDEFRIVGTVAGVFEITCLAFGPDGLLYGGDYPGGHFWSLDVNTGQGGSLGQPVPGDTAVYAVVAGADGKMYGGTGWEQGHLFSYDIAGGTFESFGAPVWRDTRLYRLVIGSDSLIYGGTGSKYGRLFRFDPADHPYATPGSATSIAISPRHKHETYVPGTSEVWALEIASDGWLYASGWAAGSYAVLARWDPAAGGLMDLLGTVPGAPSVIYELVEGPDGLIYGGGGSYSAPTMFSYDPGTDAFAFLPLGLTEQSYVHALTLCPDGRIYGGTGGTGVYGELFAYDTGTEQFIYYGTALTGQEAVLSLVCSPDGTLYGGTGLGGHLFKFHPLSVPTDLGQPVSGAGSVSALVWGPDGRLYGGTDGSGHFFIYDPATGETTDLGMPYPYDPEIHALAASDDGLVFGVTGGTEGHLFSYDIATEKLADLGQVLMGEKYAYGLEPSTDGQAVYLGTGYVLGELVTYKRGYQFGWLGLEYGADLPAGTELAVDVLDTAGQVLLAGLPSGASLLEIQPSAHPAIQLRATLNTDDPAFTPALQDWSVTWTEDPVLFVTPPGLAFQAPVDGPDPDLQSLVVTNESGGELAWTVSGAPEWLSLDPPSGVAPSTTEVTAHVEGLAAGVYSATLLFGGGPDCANCPVEVPVALTVRDRPFLVVTPPALAFEAVEGETEPQAADLSLANAGAGILTWTLTLDADWLAATPEDGVLPPVATVTVSADPAGLAAGSYAAAITIDGPPECENCPVTVPVTLTLLPPTQRVYLPLMRR